MAECEGDGERDGGCWGVLRSQPPHLQVFNISSHLASQPLLLTDLVPEGSGCRTPSVEEKKPLHPFPCATGSLGRVAGAPQFGDNVLTSAFPFLAFSICCLSAHPPFQGNFQAWGSRSTIALLEPHAWKFPVKGRWAGGSVGRRCLAQCTRSRYPVLAQGLQLIFPH